MTWTLSASAGLPTTGADGEDGVAAGVVDLAAAEGYESLTGAGRLDAQPASDAISINAAA
jgi:hypothetical protein